MDQGYDDSFSLSTLQVVPDCESRSALGETADGGLLDIFTRDFGPPGCPTFEAARNNFLRSEAGCDSCRSHMSLYSLAFLRRKLACRDIELQLAIGCFQHVEVQPSQAMAQRRLWLTWHELLAHPH